MRRWGAVAETTEAQNEGRRPTRHNRLVEGGTVRFVTMYLLKTINLVNVAPVGSNRADRLVRHRVVPRRPRDCVMCIAVIIWGRKIGTLHVTMWGLIIFWGGPPLIFLEAILILGRLIGYLVVALGLSLLVYGFAVPAFVASSYFLAGGVLVAFGTLLARLFRNRKKALEKEARRMAEVEKRKTEILNGE